MNRNLQVLTHIDIKDKQKSYFFNYRHCSPICFTLSVFARLGFLKVSPQRGALVLLISISLPWGLLGSKNLSTPVIQKTKLRRKHHIKHLINTFYLKYTCFPFSGGHLRHSESFFCQVYSRL